MATKVVNSFMLIDRKGNFNERIEKELKLDGKNSPLAVVSIIGAQSSGKSTLLNHMFGTEFNVMDAKSGRHQTTRGIWVSKYSSNRGCILVIDTEGSDGRERGGNETFARQTALFAMAISDIVIINMMCTDVGRESGGGWPLLETACEVMLRRFKTHHQVDLLFVLRDKTDSPVKVLKRQIMDDMEKILNKETRSQAQAHASLSELFEIEVVAASHYLHKRRNFNVEVDWIRDWIDSRATSNKSIPSPSFTTYAKTIWKEVKANKSLDLPSYRIMAAREHCDRIARDQCKFFCQNKSWLQIKENVESGSIIQGFGMDVSDLIRTRLSRYDENAKFHDKTTRNKRRKQLIGELLQIIWPTYNRLVERMRIEILDDFKEAALDELETKGKLKAVKVEDFITEFDVQLQDANIEEAYCTDTESTHREALRSAMKMFVDAINAINAKLDKQKMPRKSTWKKIAGVFRVVTVVAAGLVLPTLSAAGVPVDLFHLVLEMFGLSQ